MSLIAALIAAGFALLLVEIFLPGLIAGALGVLILLGALFLAGTRFGTEGVLWTLGVEIALGSLLFALWMKYFPGSRLGARFSLPEAEVQESSTAAAAAITPGQTGVTLTPLRPSGTARIEGRRVDVITEATHLEAGTQVTVVKVAGPAIVVRAIQPSPTTPT